MKKFRVPIWKTIIILAVIVFAAYFLAPNIQWVYHTFADTDISEEEKERLDLKKVPLGLDLQGGVHLVLSVDLDRALETEIGTYLSELRNRVQEEGYDIETVMVDDRNIQIRTEDPTAWGAVEEVIQTHYPDLFTNIDGVDFEGMQVDLTLDQRRMDVSLERATEQSIMVLNNRVDELGLVQPSISRAGRDRILIQLPGETDPDHAITNILRPAHLEFKLVAPQEYQREVIDEEGNLKEDYDLPEEYQVLRMSEDAEGGRRPVVLERVPLLTGRYLESANVGRDATGFGEIYVGLNFNMEGARLFQRITRENVGEQLAIVLDDTVFSTPSIRQEIPGGTARIDGRFSVDEAQDLANVLNAGALPVPLRIAENRVVGPSLGADFIEQGVTSIAWGFVAVMAFMLIYYGFAGLLANIALLLNLAIVISIMTLLGGTLTLPGIAGLILTVGMAVDANVIIYERIREELRKGKTIRSAVADGYARAFVTIFDSNLTTVVAALILLEFGTGPIQGFAVTLTMGIIASMFTALFVTRYIFDFILSNPKVQKVSLGMGHILSDTKIAFLRFRKPAALLSLLILFASFYNFAYRGMNWGIDFAGGTSMHVEFKEMATSENVRSVMAGAGFDGVQVQELVGDGEGAEASSEFFVKIPEVVEEDMEEVNRAVMQALEGSEILPAFEILQVDTVGSEVGRQFRGIALTCLLFASIAIILYLWWRFELHFGVAAIVALLHDLLITLGILSFLGKDISLTTVAALLTIMGYSVNDTIVIFDRIRENLPLRKTHPLEKILNLSINESLSRTVITSLTTLMVVLIMYIFGGMAIRDNFALPLLIGIIVGTYSSSFVASPVVYAWDKRKKIGKESVQ